jgi:Protein of unknown function (DUF3800)
MASTSHQKLYAYVDESGQETAGRLFVVSVLLLAEEREALLPRLEAIEARSGKHNTKWQKTRHTYRQAYMEEIRGLALVHQTLFFDILRQSRDYMELTARTTARAIQRKAQAPYKVTVFVDGLRRHEIPLFSKALRRLHIRTSKDRGVRREENDACIRLADAVCGLVRDAEEHQPWARTMLESLQQRGIVTKLVTKCNESLEMPDTRRWGCEPEHAGAKRSFVFPLHW